MIHTVSPMANVETCFNLPFLAEYHPSIWNLDASIWKKLPGACSSINLKLWTRPLGSCCQFGRGHLCRHPIRVRCRQFHGHPTGVVTVVRLRFLKAHQFSLFWFVPLWSGTSLTWQRSDCKWRKLWEAQEDYQNGWSQDDFSPLEWPVFRHHRQSQYA